MIQRVTSGNQNLKRVPGGRRFKSCPRDQMFKPPIGRLFCCMTRRSQAHNAEAAELTHGLKAVALLSLSRFAYDASAILWPSVAILAIAKIASIRAIVSIR